MEPMTYPKVARQGCQQYLLRETNPTEENNLNRELARLYDEWDEIVSTHEFYRKALEAIWADADEPGSEGVQHGLYIIGQWLKQRELRSLEHLSEIRLELKQQAEGDLETKTTH